MASNYSKIMKNELERMWKESVSAKFKILFRHLSGGTEDNHEYCHHWSVLGWDSNRTALEYKLELLPFFWIWYKDLYFVTTALSRCFYNPIWRTWSLFLCTCSQGDFTYHLRSNLLVWANSWTQFRSFRLCCRPERTAPNISVLKLLCPIRYISHPLWSCLRSSVDLVEIN